MNKYIIPLIFFFLGIVTTAIGALFKITHWPGANFMLFAGMLFEAIGIIILIVQILRKTK